MSEVDLINISSKDLFTEVLRRYKCNFRPFGSASFLGPRGVGKTTQATRVAEMNCWCYVNLNESAFKEFEKKKERDEAMVEVVMRRIKEPICAHGASFDGFPMNVEQAEMFDRRLGQESVNIDRVVGFKRKVGEEADEFEKVMRYYRGKTAVVEVEAGIGKEAVWNQLHNVFNKNDRKDS